MGQTVCLENNGDDSYWLPYWKSYAALFRPSLYTLNSLLLLSLVPAYRKVCTPLISPLVPASWW